MDIKLETVGCNICGTDSYTIWKPKARGIYTGFWQLVRCKKCGVVYVNPRPTPDTIHLFYSDGFYSSVWANDKDGIGAIKDKLVRMVAEEYDGYTRGGLRSSMISNLVRRVVAYPYRYKLSRIPPRRSQGRLLDIGSGSGIDLDLAKDLGWDTYGLDFSDEAASIGEKKGHKMVCGALESANYSDGFFDAVIMMDVVEHLHDPKRTLREVYRILSDGGQLLIRIPDIGSTQARLFGSRWWPLVHLPHHLYFFSNTTIGNLLNEIGFQIVRTAHATSPRCSKQYLDYLWADTQAFKLEKLPSWVRIVDSIAGSFVYLCIEAFSLGDELMILAEKPCHPILGGDQASSNSSTE